MQHAWLNEGQQRLEPFKRVQATRVGANDERARQGIGDHCREQVNCVGLLTRSEVAGDALYIPIIYFIA